MNIALKRVYEPKSPADGFRVLVDRLWPRGLSKEKAGVDLWEKEIAPSTELRTWFNHEAEKWPEFQRRYAEELKNNPQAVRDFQNRLLGHDTVTLLFAARDEDHNQALVLRELLRKWGL